MLVDQCDMVSLMKEAQKAESGAFLLLMILHHAPGITRLDWMPFLGVKQDIFIFYFLHSPVLLHPSDGFVLVELPLKFVLM